MKFSFKRMTGRRRGRGVRRQPGQMNGLEKAYAEHLTTLIAAGEVLEFWFDCVKLRLADKCFYTPDFFVMMADDTIEVHETKGFMEEDAAVKLKVAADKYPFIFKLVKRLAKRDGGGWVIKEVGNGSQSTAD